MKNFTKSLAVFQQVDNAYAQELIPCQDGTMADASVGCAAAPESVTNPESSLTVIALNAASVLMTIIAVAAVCMIIVAAIQYASSAGDDFKISRAKRIFFWSILGLIIAVLARFAVNFVIVFVT